MNDFFKCTHRGSISSGTLRNQDLIKAFIEAILEIAPEREAEVSTRVPPNLVPESGWWDSDDALWLLEELFVILDEHAPKGHYFGARPGDRYDFGFWAIEED